LSFAPTAVGTRSGTLTIASNASNGNGVVTLSGSGVQISMSVNPTAAAMQAPMGATSAPVQVTVANTGASPLTVSSIAVTGPFLLQLGSNTCGAGPMQLSPGQSCNVYVAFQPTTDGAVSGKLTISSTASAAPTVIALSAQTLDTQTTSVGTGSASNVGLGGCSVGAPDQLVDPLLALMLAIAVFVVLRRRAKPSAR
jgi:hypothetical protein